MEWYKEPEATSKIFSSSSPLKNDLKEKIKKFEKATDQWICHRNCYIYAPSYASEVSEIVDSTQQLINSKSRRLKSTIVKVALPILVSIGLLIGGAILGSTLGCCLAGVGLLIFVRAIYIACRSTKDGNRNIDQKAANEILTKIKTLQSKAFHYEAGLHFKIESVIIKD